MSRNLYKEILDIEIEAEKPLNLYTLLGLKLFEADPDAIHKAGLEQLKKLRKWQLHPDKATSEFIQQMLNQVSRACTTLEVPDKKKEYDVSLSSRLGVSYKPTLSVKREDAEEIQKRLKQCPNCGTQASALAAICIECGYDFQTRQILKTNIEKLPEFDFDQVKERGMDFLFKLEQVLNYLWYYTLRYLFPALFAAVLAVWFYMHIFNKKPYEIDDKEAWYADRSYKELISERIDKSDCWSFYFNCRKSEKSTRAPYIKVIIGGIAAEAKNYIQVKDMKSNGMLFEKSFDRGNSKQNKNVLSAELPKIAFQLLGEFAADNISVRKKIFENLEKSDNAHTLAWFEMFKSLGKKAEFAVPGICGKIRKSNDPELRGKALYVLKEIAREERSMDEIIKLLPELLNDNSPHLGKPVSEICKFVGSDALPVLINSLKNTTDEEKKIRLLELISMFGKDAQELLPELIKIIASSSSPDLLEKAIMCRENIPVRDAETISLLGKLEQSESLKVRHAAIHAARKLSTFKKTGMTQTAGGRVETEKITEKTSEKRQEVYPPEKAEEKETVTGSLKNEIAELEKKIEKIERESFEFRRDFKGDIKTIKGRVFKNAIITAANAKRDGKEGIEIISDEGTVFLSSNELGSEFLYKTGFRIPDMKTYLERKKKELAELDASNVSVADTSTGNAKFNQDYDYVRDYIKHAIDLYNNKSDMAYYALFMAASFGRDKARLMKMLGQLQDPQKNGVKFSKGDAEEIIYTISSVLGGIDETIENLYASIRNCEQLEAAILLDENIVGNGKVVGAALKKISLMAFVHKTPVSLDDISNKYGSPDKTLVSNAGTKYVFYGKVIFMKKTSWANFAVLFFPKEGISSVRKSAASKTPEAEKTPSTPEKVMETNDVSRSEKGEEKEITRAGTKEILKKEISELEKEIETKELAVSKFKKDFRGDIKTINGTVFKNATVTAVNVMKNGQQGIEIISDKGVFFLQSNELGAEFQNKTGSRLPEMKADLEKKKRNLEDLEASEVTEMNKGDARFNQNYDYVKDYIKYATDLYNTPNDMAYYALFMAASFGRDKARLMKMLSQLQDPQKNGVRASVGDTAQVLYAIRSVLGGIDEAIENLYTPIKSRSQVEAAIILDKSIVGNGKVVGATKKSIPLMAFIYKTSISLDDISNKYGNPDRTLLSNAGTRYVFYGRVIFMKKTSWANLAVLFFPKDGTSSALVNQSEKSSALQKKSETGQEAALQDLKKESLQKINEKKQNKLYDETICSRCQGKGYIDKDKVNSGSPDKKMDFITKTKCPRCNGEGKIKEYSF